MFVTVPFIFCILGVPKILKWLDDCNHVKVYFLEVSVVNFVSMWISVRKSLSEVCWGDRSRENLSVSVETVSLNPNSGSEYAKTEEEVWIGKHSWAFALCSISNWHECVASGTARQRRLLHVQKGVFKKNCQHSRIKYCWYCICTVKFALLESYVSVIFIGQLSNTWVVGYSME